MTDDRHWRGWYSLTRWHHLRKHQLAQHPLCSFCLASEVVEPATVVDHVEPHRGDPDLFWDPGNLQSLCKAHHDRDKQLIEHGKSVIHFGPDGWPL